jgi:calcium channel MID1
MLALAVLAFCSQVLAQSQQLLTLNQVFSQGNSPPPANFLIPAGQQLLVSVALCASVQQPPRFIVTNSSTDADDDSDDVFEIPLTNGYGTLPVAAGGVIAVQNDGANVPFEIAVSDSNAPLHLLLDHPPLLGDTTANQALLFSPPFDPVPILVPSYPNYSLPVANQSLPDPPSSATTFSLLIEQTGAQALAALPQTACAIKAINGTGSVVSQQLWLRDTNGFRNQWLVEGLSPATNYTVYVVVNGTQLSGPSYFVTKSGELSLFF